MISTFVFEFPNGAVYCAGDEAAVKRVINYFRLQDKVYGRNIDMAKFVDRIVMNRVYAYLEPGTVKDRFLDRIRGYNRILESQGLLMTEDEYIEATVLAFPEVCCKALELSKEEFVAIQRDSIWGGRVDLS